MKIKENKNKLHITIETEEDVIEISNMIKGPKFAVKDSFTIGFNVNVKYPKEEFYRLLKGE